MAWGRIDDNLHSSPKWMMASKGGRALWTSALSWCMSHLTDGEVPKYVLPILGASTQDARSLIAAGLWEDHGTCFKFHDWMDYQPSREQVLADRESARQRQKRARHKATQPRQDNGVSHGVTSGEVHPLVTVPPTQPNPLEVSKDTSRQAADAATEASFESWWKLYPRKIGKGQARKAFKAALKKTDLDTLTDGVESYAESMTGKDQQYIAHPATWLNGERWDDEPPPPAQKNPWDYTEEDYKRAEEELERRASNRAGGNPR